MCAWFERHIMPRQSRNRQPVHLYAAQFWTLSLRTRRNSFSLLVTSVSASANRTVGLRSDLGERDCRKQSSEFMQSLKGSLSLRTLLRAVSQFPVSDDRNSRLSRTKPLKAAQYRFRTLLPNVNHYVGVEQIARLHLQALAFLGKIILREFEIIWQNRDQVKSSRQRGRHFPKDNLIAAAEDFHFLAFELKLLRQPHRLAISRTENSRCSHRHLLRMCIYAQDIHCFPAGFNCVRQR